MAAAHAYIPETLVISYLEMTHPDQFEPAYADDLRGVSIVKMDYPDVSFYRFLYDSVGDIWGWRDRRFMADGELEAAIMGDGVSIYVMYVEGVPSGYVELAQQDDEIEIAYFGLRPKYHGRGLGKHLLSYGISKAWESGAQRVVVHTCNLDAASALPNYLKRGFCVYHVTEEIMPDRYKV